MKNEIKKIALSYLLILMPCIANAQSDNKSSEIIDRSFAMDENWETFISINEASANSIGYDGLYISDKLKNGAEVEVVEAGSPAEKAGIHVGDLVTAINGKSIINMKSNDVIGLSSGQVRDTITYTIVDKQKLTKNIKVTLSKGFYPENLFPELARHSLVSSMNALTPEMLTIGWTTIANLYACSTSASDLNEFERLRYKKALVERWNSRAETIKANDTIYIPVAVHLGEYDFKSKQFNIEYFNTAKGFKLGSISFERDSRLPATYLGNGIFFGNGGERERNPETVPINAVVVDTPNGADRSMSEKSSTQCVNESTPDNLTFASKDFNSGIAILFRYSQSLAKKVSAQDFKVNSLGFFDSATLTSVPTNRRKGVGIAIDPINAEPDVAEKLLQITGEERIIYYIIEGKVIGSVPSDKVPENTPQDINGETANIETLAPTVIAVPLIIHVLAPNMQEIGTKEIHWAEGTGDW